MKAEEKTFAFMFCSVVMQFLPLPVLKNMVDEIFARENKMESASFRTEYGPSVFIL